MYAIDRNGNTERINSDRVTYAPPPENGPTKYENAKTTEHLEENTDGPIYVADTLVTNRRTTEGTPEFLVRWYVWYNDFYAYEYYVNPGSFRINGESDQRWTRMGAETSRRNGDPRTTDYTLPTPTRLRRSGGGRHSDSGRRADTGDNTVTMTVTTCGTDIYVQTYERRIPTTSI